MFKPNLFGLPTAANYDDWISKQPKQDRQYVSLELIDSLKTALADQDCQHLAELLLSIPGNTRLDLLQKELLQEVGKRERGKGER